MVWSLALRHDDAKQDPVVYGTKSGVVFLAESPRAASIQKGFDCFGLYHPGLERERDIWWDTHDRACVNIRWHQKERNAYSWEFPATPPLAR